MQPAVIELDGTLRGYGFENNGEPEACRVSAPSGSAVSFRMVRRRRSVSAAARRTLPELVADRRRLRLLHHRDGEGRLVGEGRWVHRGRQHHRLGQDQPDPSAEKSGEPRRLHGNADRDQARPAGRAATGAAYRTTSARPSISRSGPTTSSLIRARRSSPIPRRTSRWLRSPTTVSGATSTDLS